MYGCHPIYVRAEDNLWESALFCPVGPMELRPSILAPSSPHPLSCLATPPFCCRRPGLSVNLGLTYLLRLAGHQVPRICLHLPSTGVSCNPTHQALPVNATDPKSGPHTYASTTWLTSHLPRLLVKLPKFNSGNFLPEQSIPVTASCTIKRLRRRNALVTIQLKWNREIPKTLLMGRILERGLSNHTAFSLLLYRLAHPQLVQP